MVATFTTSIGDSLSFSLKLDQFPATIGRDANATIQLVDPWVSRRHCRIEIDGDRLVVKDIGSTYGTFVNHEAVTEAVLLSGDELQVGISLFRVKYQPTRLRVKFENSRSGGSKHPLAVDSTPA
ncbi:MAG: FHA domain-containing protein [Planctomycetota bacterium]|nr:FHA domain-containing protein [Planctomycetota bacterium]MDA1163594.1 FHA domain-containing protein [Planctomycetota bacterium]